MTAINSNRAIRGPVTAVPVVAGKGVRLVADTENNRWVVEADETVLFTKTFNLDDFWSSEALSESILNFDRIRITWKRNNTLCPLFCSEHYVSDINNVEQLMSIDADISGTIYRYFTKYKINGSTYSDIAGRYYQYGGTINGWQSEHVWCHPIRIVGINRIASN